MSDTMDQGCCIPTPCTIVRGLRLSPKEDQLFLGEKAKEAEPASGMFYRPF